MDGWRTGDTGADPHAWRQPLAGRSLAVESDRDGGPVHASSGEDREGAEDQAPRGLAGAAGAALAAYRAGDPVPLGDLVRDASPLLWHAVRAQGVDRDRAEDVVQGVWLSLVRHAESIRDPDAVLQWLLVTARRSAWEAVRRQREDARRGVAADVALLDLPASGPRPEDPVIVAERDRVLWRRFRELSARCQTILRMVALADRPDYRAIAAATGIPVGNVGVTRGRCLAKLRTLLASDEMWVNT